MTCTTILDELKKLTDAERLAVIEEATRLMRKSFEQKSASTAQDQSSQMAAAAALLLSDYESDAELTAFTALDAEGFPNEER